MPLVLIGIACVHRIPPHVRDDGQRPSCRGGTRSDNHNFGKNEIGIFSRWGLATRIGLIRLANFVLKRRPIFGRLRRRGPRDMTNIELICPTSGAVFVAMTGAPYLAAAEFVAKPPRRLKARG
jgi:hypothetical protein